MTKTEFNDLLNQASILSLDFAKKHVTDTLHDNFLYTVKLNVSNDDPNLKQFDIYPADNDKIIKLISSTEVVDLLFRKNKVPVWIDISVDSVHKKHTVFELLCAGRYSNDINEYYYSKQGTGPFGIKSPSLPYGYKDGDKFALKKKKFFFSWLTKN